MLARVAGRPRHRDRRQAPGGRGTRAGRPTVATETFHAWRRRTRGREPDPGDPATVLLWPDTFTNYFQPHIGQSTVRVLESAGFQVAVPTEPVCCGLTWISTGQLDTAKRMPRRTAVALWPWLDAGILVVGLEPSCTRGLPVGAGELCRAGGAVRHTRRRRRFSCRTQIEQAGTGRRALHLAELLTLDEAADERAVAPRPVTPRVAGRLVTAVNVLAPAVWSAARLWRTLGR